MTKHTYAFGGGDADGSATMKGLLGGKGANLAEMCRLGLPVPPGFTITTKVCTYFNEHEHAWPEGLEEQVEAQVARMQELVGKKFGDAENPLLVSVRSGAKFSMPGMMDTVLNLGLNDTTVKGLIARTNNERFGYDAYRRFIQMYADVVMGIDSELFEEKLTAKRNKVGVKTDAELPADALKELVVEYKQVVKDNSATPFPEEPRKQLHGAIDAVFGSWMNNRAIVYRRLHNISASLGTAVNVQAMVFGNMGNTSLSGVAFSRDPAQGTNVFYGEYLVNAQGEDVVAGIRTPQKVALMEQEFPTQFKELLEHSARLEHHYKDLQDMEFTVEENKLYMLQTRIGKRTARAAVQIAVDMANEGLITRNEAILRLEPGQIDQLLHPTIAPGAKLNVVATGLPASPGAAVGKVVFTAAAAVEHTHRTGESVILVREETSPEDVEGMHVAAGILTSRGGMTSHAAVVCRGMGRCCVAGCSAVVVREREHKVMIGDVEVNELDTITLNGTTGEVVLGDTPLVTPELTGAFKELLDWSDRERDIGVHANADNPEDAKLARSFGATGVGLCRTEHMFFGEQRLPAMRRMILAQTEEARREALATLLPFQREDFRGILSAMQGLPVTIRLLDPPLHEFLPHSAEDQKLLAQQLSIDEQTVKDAVKRLKEFNPMLGHRGCRLGLTFPEITQMQARAVLEAACSLAKEGVDVHPEIMIPLVSHVNEFVAAKTIVDDEAAKVIAETGVAVKYRVGTMIEVPRACVVADAIANSAEFFSFGTNDLTQMTFGFSRDDASKFLRTYQRDEILPHDPFQTLDDGVAELMNQAITRGRGARSDLTLGVCGEHGGDPASIEKCHALGVDYVSCSPFRVPVARFSAAQSSLRRKQAKEPKHAAHI